MSVEESSRSLPTAPWSVRGNATPEELAAAVAVLSSRPSAEVEAVPPARSRWNDRPSLLRQPLPHGPGAWRAASPLR